jgi:hypothetical protein
MKLMDVVWRGESGKALVTDKIEVTVLPRHGAKIASLRYLPTEREWLEQPDRELREPPEYGSVFTDGDMFGWDEMVPTIIGCTYPDGLHRGVTLPDHGEVWTLVWSAERDGEALVCRTMGRVLPYRLTRTMRVEGSRLQLDYELATTGSTPLWLLWAAHPQFVISQFGTRVVLPPEVNRLVDVTPGRRPHTVHWPSAAVESSLGLPKGVGRKLYLPPEAHVGAVALIDGDDCWLRLAWNPTVVPYLGIWLDNGAYARHPVIALEPTTGYYDDLALAVSQGRLPRVPPEQPLQWSVEVTLGRGQLP